MAKTYEFTAPNGKTYEITGPDSATAEQAFAVLQQQMTPQKRETSIGEDIVEGAADFGRGLITGAAGIGRGILQAPKLVGLPPIGGQEFIDNSKGAAERVAKHGHFSGLNLEGQRNEKTFMGSAGEFTSELAATGGVGGLVRKGAAMYLPRAAAALSKAPTTMAAIEGAGAGVLTGDGNWSDVGIGAGGGVLGQKLVQGGGAILRGAKQTPQAEALRRQGIDVTAGQGSTGIIHGLEEAAQYLPISANAVRAQRARPYEQIRQRVAREAQPPADPMLPGPVTPQVAPRGGNMDEILANARSGFQQRYDDVIKGKVFEEDAAFAKEIADYILHPPHTLSDSQLTGVARFVNDQLNPGRRQGGWTGEQLTVIRQNLERQANSSTNPQVAQSLHDISDKIMEMMARQSPEVGKVHATMAPAYKNLVTAENAARSVPAQGNFGVAGLANAAEQTHNSGMRRFAREAATVLADDLKRGGAGVRTAIGVGALAGSGLYGGSHGVASTAAVPTSLYLLLGTKTGQKLASGQFKSQKQLAEFLRKHPTAGSSTGAVSAQDLLGE